MLLLHDNDHHVRIYTAMIYFVNIIVLQEGKALDQSFTEIQPANIPSWYMALYIHSPIEQSGP